MDIELNVAPALETENTLADTAIEQPGNADTDNTEGEPPELTEAEKKAADAENKSKALERRISRMTREKYQREAQLDQYRQAAPKPTETTNQPLTEEEVNRRASVIADVREFNAKCDRVNSTGTKQFSDFGKVFAELSQEVPTFVDNRATPFMEALLDANDPAALIHHLGTNPDLASELADLNPRQQIRRLALIERDLDAAPKPKPSNAPKPLSTVKPSGSKGSVDPSDSAAWIREQNRLEASGRR
jgi:hypothetical protein